MQTILAIDDEFGVREAYRLILSEQYRVLPAGDGAAALKIIEETHVDLVLLDLMMPGISGMDLLVEIAKRDSFIPIVVITAMKSVSTAVEAMKLGAREYIIKPFDVDEILLAVERTLCERKNQSELKALREAGIRGFESLIGRGPVFMDALDLARRAMRVDSTVLITGETGTGKDLVARAIHSGGNRAQEALVAVSCCAIPDQLVESELFGHERGSFTGATEKRVGKIRIADRGTLFLDEIGEMPLDAQAKLLRVLQNGQFYPVGSTKVIEVDVRFICATNRSLVDAVAQGLFRQDLYYRINVLHIEMPPLRKRREDIPLLAGHFLAKHAPRVNAQATGFTPAGLACLCSHSWPGNVRELENLVERVLVHHSHVSGIDAPHLDALLPRESAGRKTPSGGDEWGEELDGLTLEEATRRLERRLIMRALERTGKVQSRAAELLGTTRRILKYKMDLLGIAPESGEPSELSA